MRTPNDVKPVTQIWYEETVRILIHEDGYQPIIAKQLAKQMMKRLSVLPPVTRHSTATL